MDEHAVLIHRLGRVQTRMTHVVRQMVERIHELESEVLRLRARLIISRTCALWGLPTIAHATPILQGGQRVQTFAAGGRSLIWPEAEQVICQTGCISQAHHWLGEAGQCRRDGEPCGQMAEEAGRHVSAA